MEWGQSSCEVQHYSGYYCGDLKSVVGYKYLEFGGRDQIWFSDRWGLKLWDWVSSLREHLLMGKKIQGEDLRIIQQVEAKQSKETQQAEWKIVTTWGQKVLYWLTFGMTLRQLLSNMLPLLLFFFCWDIYNILLNCNTFHTSMTQTLP